MAPRELPDAAYLRQRLSYDPESGVLLWRPKPLHECADARSKNVWDAQHAGKIAATRECHRSLKTKFNGATWKAHRIIFKMMTERDPIEEIDHIDRNWRNNRWNNLREASRRENGSNIVGRRTKYFDLPKGVYPAESGRWTASIKHKGRGLRLGTYDTPEEAHAAYREAAEQLHGEFANFGHCTHGAK